MKKLLLYLLLGLLFIKVGATSDTIYINNKFLTEYSAQEKQYTWLFINDDDSANAQIGINKTGHFVSPSYESNDSLFKQLKGGIGWFRVWIKANPEVLGKSVALNFNGFGIIDVYLDGMLVSSNPEKETSPRENIKLDNFPAFISLSDTNAHLISIRYENPNIINPDLYDEWGFIVRFSYSEDLFAAKINSIKMLSVFILPIGSIFATLFLVHILMFFFYRKDISNFYFALFNIGCTSFIFTIYAAAATNINITNSFWLTILITISCIVACYSISAFCTDLFVKRKIFIRIIGVLCVIMVLATVLFYKSKDYSGFIDIGLGTLAAITCVYIVIIFIVAMIKKIKGSSILGAGILFTIFFVLGLILTSIITGGDLSTSSMVLGIILVILGILAIFSIPLSISAFLAWRYASTSRNLQLQLDNVAALSEKTIQQEKEKQAILENQKADLEIQVAVRTEEIVKEKQKSDELLLNILPHEIAEELKAKGESKAQHYTETSVLFTDFVNFTQVAETLGVEQLLKELNINFTAFDKIMEKYGLEKIKTIGDAYLAVSGLPIANPNHAQNTVKAAIEITEFVTQRRKEVSYAFDIRIGINSGPLIAGIIGVKKFAYDIWGDTVNIAARMEQNSLPGEINISGNTYQLVKDNFECTYRGKIAVKGKGEMDMYFVK